MNVKQTRRVRRQKRSYRRVMILLAVCIFFGAVAGAFKYIDTQYDRSHGAPGQIFANDKLNIMIMGVDRRADDVGRSDTLMVATIDKKNKQAALLSVPRDTRVAIEGNGFDKINAAYAYGGSKLSRSAVENLLGTPIQYYILVDIKAFERIIDALGGIDLNVEKRMYYEDPWDDDGGLVIDLYPGEQHLDGKRAIEYVRYRDGEGDIGRIGRQQKFMKAVLEKLLTPSVLPKLPDFIKEVRSAVETDMPLNEMISLGKDLSAFREKGIETSMVPGKPAYLQDVSYWLPELPELRQMMAERMLIPFDEKLQAAADETAAQWKASIPQEVQVVKESASDGKTEKKTGIARKPEEVTVLVINSSGINGAGARVADTLRQKGFRISGVETGKSSSMQHTALTAAQSEVQMFYGMPFPCTLMVGGESGQATIIIGKDYQK